MASDELGPDLLQALRVRLLKAFPAQIRACLEQLDEAQIWWRPNAESNSAGNIVLHVAGSMREFIGKRIGGFPYQRNREREFAEQGPMPRAEVLAIFDEALATAEKTLDQLTAERLLGPSVDPERHRLLLEDLVSQTTHVAAHAGQMALLTKMLRGGSLDNLWMKAHRESGAWKS